MRVCRGIFTKCFIYLFKSLPPYGAEYTTERGSNLIISVSLHPAKERLVIPLGSTSPTLFEQSFTSHKNQISESAVRQDLRVFVLIRVD